MFKDLGKLKYISKKTLISIPLQEIPQDISVHPSLIIYREDEGLHVYDRRCDHNGGTLCLMNNSIKCPMHDWEFDAKTGQYKNVQVSKQELNYEISNENIIVEVSEDIPILENTEEKLAIKVTFLSHACLLIETDEFSFVTDPWIIGFAFAGGWWPKIIPPTDWESIVNSADFIYISHNHPDHLNLFTLENIRKDMDFIVPGFQSESVSKLLQKNGFVNIFPANLHNYYQYKDTSLFITILKSGDFRDDSGIYFTYGKFSFLSTVDSNDLNFKKFPKNVTLFTSSFASGASGYPLCFDTLSESDKIKILDRNRMASKAMVKFNIKKCSPKYFMPYAGFFEEKAKRDSEILRRNLKNKIKDYEDIDGELLNIDNFDSYFFKGQKMIEQKLISRNKAQLDSPEVFISKAFNRYLYDENFIKRYFDKSGFKKELMLYVTLTNDDFSQILNYITVDFREEKTQIKFDHFYWDEIKTDLNQSEVYSFNSLHIKVRQDSFLWLIYNQMPWEDLSIGFQCRIDRVPDVYNVDFWYHFTNIYL